MDSERLDIVVSKVERHPAKLGFESERARRKRLDEGTRSGMPIRDKALLFVGGFVTIGAAIVFVGNRCADLQSDLEVFGNQMSTEAGLLPSANFSVVDGAVPEKVVTKNWGRVRKDSVMTDDVILGYAGPGQLTDGIIGTGAVYNHSGEGYTMRRDGFEEGIWYKVSEVQLFEEKDGQYVPMTDENGDWVFARNAVIADPFIRPATQEDLAGLQPVQPNP